MYFFLEEHFFRSNLWSISYRFWVTVVFILDYTGKNKYLKNGYTWCRDFFTVTRTSYELYFELKIKFLKKCLFREIWQKKLQMLTFWIFFRVNLIFKFLSKSPSYKLSKSSTFFKIGWKTKKLQHFEYLPKTKFFCFRKFSTWHPTPPCWNFHPKKYTNFLVRVG